MFPFTVILGETIASVGIAASAVDDLIDLVRDKTPNYNATPLKEQQLAQFEAGRAQALVHAARDTLYRAADEAYDEAEASGQPLSWDAKIRLQLAVSFAAETSAEAVRLVHNVAGASGIRLEAPFERYFRDVHVLTQHTSKARPRYAHAGKLMFGLENDWIWAQLLMPPVPESQVARARQVPACLRRERHVHRGVGVEEPPGAEGEAAAVDGRDREILGADDVAGANGVPDDDVLAFEHPASPR